MVRALWAGSAEPVRTEHYDVPAVAMVAPSQRGGPPILIEAGSELGLESAARLGDGLLHPGGTPQEVAAAIARVLALRKRDGRGGGFEVWTRVPAPPSRAGWKETIDAYGSTGITGLIVPYDPRLLDLLRNPDVEDDRSDLALAQG